MPQNRLWNKYTTTLLIAGSICIMASAWAGEPDNLVGVTVGYHATDGVMDGTKAVILEGEQELSILPHLEGNTFGLCYNFLPPQADRGEILLYNDTSHGSNTTAWVCIDLSINVSVKPLQIPRFNGPAVHLLANLDIEYGLVKIGPLHQYALVGIGYSLLWIADGTLQYDDEGGSVTNNSRWHGPTPGIGVGLYLRVCRQLRFKVEASYRWTYYGFGGFIGRDKTISITALH